MSNQSATLMHPAAVTLTTGTPPTPAAQAARPTGTVFILFPAVAYGSIQERFINNPNAAGSLWVTFFDGYVPAANAEGSFEIPPGGSWSGGVCNEIRYINTVANMAVTAGERG